jgi:hypothetical protein
MIKHVNGLVLIRLVSSIIFPLIFILIQINCEELIEGYENPVAGVAQSTDNEADDVEDEDITGDMGTSSKKGKSPSSSSSSSSSKSISILTRSISEYDTCAPEKSVDFDPVQGN